MIWSDVVTKPWWWVNEDTKVFLERGYLLPGVSVEERLWQVADTAEKYLGMPGYAAKLFSYMAKGWVSLSSPVWANFGLNRGLPISCNGSVAGDSVASILYTAAEVGMMSKYGAGTSIYLGKVRPRGSEISSGGKSDGPVRFSEIFQVVTDVVSQGNVRRGSCALYLPVEHPDIEEFLECREEGHPIQHLSLGVCVSDAWMQEMLGGDTAKRKVWVRILKKRLETGYPYLFFADRANRAKSLVYRKAGMPVVASNLCTEILLPSSEKESFVCCLASVNLVGWDEWQHTDLIKTVVMLLDAVMQEYIEKTKVLSFMERAHDFAVRHRALGLGVLGWHTLLQMKMLPFGSTEAKALNRKIFAHILSESEEASKMLAEKKGEPEVCMKVGEKRRNAALRAVAPTTSSSFILGQVSPSIEPLPANYYVKNLAKGKFTWRNPVLQRVLEDLKMDKEEVWEQILMDGGSVQRVEGLPDHVKEVFRTFREISPLDVLQQARERQPFLDQGQSLNLMVPADISPANLHDITVQAWRWGIPTLYYLRGVSPVQELARQEMCRLDEGCKVCEA